MTVVFRMNIGRNYFYEFVRYNSKNNDLYFVKSVSANQGEYIHKNHLKIVGLKRTTNDRI